MVKRCFVFLPILVLLSQSIVFTASSRESGCVQCHTDESALKSLFKPPKISHEEGEG